MEKIEEFNYKENDNLRKTPWYSYYEEQQIHLSYPNISLYDMLEQSSAQRKSLLAYHYFGHKATFQKLLADIEHCARAFKALEVEKGDKVTICMPNTPEAVVAFYALNKIGAIANMIHPLSAENEIKYYLNIAESKFLLTIDLAWGKIKNIIEETNVQKIILASVKESMPFHLKTGYHFTQGRKIEKPRKSDRIMDWKDFWQIGKQYHGNTNTHEKGNSPAVILYSGGTSGGAKGILLSNLNFNALALQSISACACLKEKDKVLSIMPIFHGFGLGICIHTVLNFGGTAILLPQFSAKTFDKLLKKYKPNVIAGVPTLYEALLQNSKIDQMDLSYLKCMISGGDSLSISLKKKLDAFLKNHHANIQVREGYGLTECVTGSCLTPQNFYKEGSIGIPYPDTYYKIVKQNTIEELPYGEVGEIVLSGPSVMLGYLKEEEATKKALRQHKDGLIWLHTGDLGYQDAEGFIYFKQRIQRVIVSSGYNIYPQYIENIIDSHPKVLMSCAVGIPHAYKQEVVKVFIVLKEPTTEQEQIEDEIRTLCEKNLAKYALPYEIAFREELPKTLVGKIAYTKLIEGEGNENKQ